MPLVEFKCPNCAASTDVFVMDWKEEAKNPTMCIAQDPFTQSMCWTPMKRQYTPPVLRGETVSKS